MATSGTFAFNLDLGDAMLDAFERCGLELRTGNDYRTANRSLNLLMLEWQNRGLNFFTLKEASTTMIVGTSDYALSSEKLEVIEAVVRKNAGETTQQDKTLNRISMSQYAHRASKKSQSEPTSFAISKAPGAITIKLYPTPSEANTLTYWYLEQIEDAGSAASKNMDIPVRYLPALVTGLAYQIALKRPKEVNVQQLVSIQSEYEKQWQLAKEGDRERSSFYMRPASSY